MPDASLSRADNRAAAADYMTDVARELAALARENGFDTLGYLFELAYLEARGLEEREGDDPIR